MNDLSTFTSYCFFDSTICGDVSFLISKTIENSDTTEKCLNPIRQLGQFGLVEGSTVGVLVVGGVGLLHEVTILKIWVV